MRHEFRRNDLPTAKRQITDTSTAVILLSQAVAGALRTYLSNHTIWITRSEESRLGK
jgi:hypothetical protein